MAIGIESSAFLLERAQDGDQAALDALLLRYLPRMRRWASGRLPAAARGPLDTEDIVQETLIKAVRNLERFDARGEGALQAYLRAALANRLADVYRQSQRRGDGTPLESDMPSRAASPLEEAIGTEALNRYERALSRLKPEDRNAVIFRVELCYDYDEIAVLLGKPTGSAARMAVSRALARLSLEMRP